MLVKKRRMFLIATFIIVTAIAVVLYVGFFTKDEKTDYDGVLAQMEKIENVDITKTLDLVKGCW